MSPQVPPPSPFEVDLASALGLDPVRVIAGSFTIRPGAGQEAVIGWEEWTAGDRIATRTSSALTMAEVDALRP